MQERLKQIALYAAPSFFAKGVSVLLLPVYTAFLSVREFGQLELLVVVLVFLQHALEIGWMAAIVRFYHEPGVARGSLLRTLLALRAGLWLPVVILVAASGLEPLAALLTHDASLGPALGCVVALFVLRDVILLYETWFRVNERATAYAVLNSSYAALQMLAVVVLLAGFGLGVFGVLAGQALASLAVVLGLQVRGAWARDEILAGRFDPTLLRRCLRFGAGFVPGLIVFWIISSSDRYMLRWLVPDPAAALEQVGIYALLGKATALLTLVVSGFKAFFAPYVFQTYREPGAPQRLAFLFRVYVAALLALSLALLVVVPWILEALLPQYAPGVPALPVLLAAFVVYHVGSDFAVGVDIAERTGIRAVGGVAGAAVTVAANLWLVPSYGYFGSAWAALAGFGVYAAILLPNSGRLYPAPYAWGCFLFSVVWIVGAAPLLARAPGWIGGYALLGALVFGALFLRAGGLRRDWVIGDAPTPAAAEPADFIGPRV